MNYTDIGFAKKDRTAIITLRRPESRNTVNARMAMEVRDACAELKQTAEISVVIITGGENEFFCCGTDWDDAAELINEGRKDYEGIIRSFSAASAIGSLDQVVIAAINGDSLGQGLELALACDIRLAAPGAKFGFPGHGAEMFPFDGATQRLPRVVGRSKALEFLLTGEVVDAPAALAVGLIHGIAGEGPVLEEAEETAKKMASKAPLSLRFAKESVLKGMDLTLEQGLRLESDLYYLLHTTE
ncbi:MAG: enoyl-CoA hydratase/isomerase family protein, partial [Dehalococcoidia bacterium]|nr:enoyl-CoA hydratase/isomerase family protein [Dehalococcoidia bacterium]